MFDPEEDRPRQKPSSVKDLSAMSIEALGDYKTELEAEIRRVEQAIADKKGHRGAAEKFFKQ
ncbi:MAG: DUF1192 domain-containing protein [Rhodospirillaceae bacterium]|jgi:uncharacterized small protein (DUF1192 family)|nr:DUF1192 domain-containing protein [Rhodospirillaceae bacterium]|tara:strand:+ start:744 stop:929 length:186 start_codon:yes stop_codon:yes gene_type:complete